jgi:biopolymer transport protein ExbD
MAGSQDPDENPVAINVVPMVDVIFCLCVFFMCSFKFKQLEGKFDSWLPKDKGLGDISQLKDVIEEVRIALFWDPKTETVTRQLGTRRVKDDDELQGLIRTAHSDWERLGKANTPVTVDAAGEVPWNEVVKVINLCKREKIDNIEFAFGTGKPIDIAPNK